jgi:hypothetical protein
MLAKPPSWIGACGLDTLATFGAPRNFSMKGASCGRVLTDMSATSGKGDSELRPENATASLDHSRITVSPPADTLISTEAG